MNVCAFEEYERVDTRLNQIWNRVRAEMRRQDEYPYEDGEPGHWESLLAAQRAWLSYRDAHCRLVSYDARGGSLQPMLMSNCLSELTRARAAQLQDLLINQVSGEAKEVGEE